MVERTVPALVALLGAPWSYRDARDRRMDTADTWAVGFVVGFPFVLLLGGLAMLAFYLGRRRRRGGSAYGVAGG
ncbi:hypothetical protein [Candidatus Halobonum tyrrellensis]|uniref:Uncharacterized protein n=1 Tax=Candidatus Halobonum tyrrellensis G22 TaxID=1324957 RepID=V4HHD1_9EURY|nr:hypothetical protein [Candidatus Halobonum tyrrellensis]ESP87279.1 hypothetical protein K933_14373 [Candidatus Halobonum tyrrellensis G22]